ncbi:hypothetical protein [Pseudomonas fragariae (ex Marin et al. 2024)]|uniref:hypothetical protein n=1 Tax=Pseudomonas fragariae (ex Marin et al. 2024) TaxID=3080056 RepID=UPI003F78E2BD
MSRPTLSEKLQEMARNHGSRSNTARLRDVFDDVEAALTAGVSRDAVLAALNDDGIAMTKQTFDKALFRIRKERSGKAAINNGKTGTITHDAPASPVKTEPARTGEPVWVSPGDLARTRNRPIDLESLSRTKATQE